MTAPGDKLSQLASAVPSLPGVVSELKKALENPDVPFNTLEKIVDKDTSFATRLLKIANSSYYGLTSKVGTISQALTVLGLSELKTLLVSTSLAQVFKGLSNENVNMESFWKHSVACAVCSRSIAIRHREQNVEEYFLAGLIHDLGRLVMLQHLAQKTEQASNMAIEKRIPITQAEEETFSFNHADLSGRILKEWKLPGNLIEMVRLHHNPLPTSPYCRQIKIIHVSDYIVDTMKIGNSGEGIISLASNGSLKLFEDNKSSLYSIVDEVEYSTEEIARIFIHE
jgi:HD-like signal output (HDOD) protein